MENFVIKGPFRISQRFKGLSHDGLDIVPYYDLNVYSNCNGVVERASWENSSNKKQGFGLYVRIRTNDNKVFYYGHLSSVSVKVGQNVKIGDILGKVGNTGKSTGLHLHYCCRLDGLKSHPINVALLHKIANKEGVYNQFVVKRSWKAPIITITPYITQAKKIAKSNKAVVYDEKGKTIYSYR